MQLCRRVIRRFLPDNQNEEGCRPGGGPRVLSRPSGWRGRGSILSFSTRNSPGRSPAAAASPIRLISEYPFLIDNRHAEEARSRDLVSRRRRPVKRSLSLIAAAGDLLAVRPESHAARARRRAGAQIEKTRVLGLERRERGWRMRTRDGVAGSRFLRRRHRRAQPAARCRHASGAAADTMCALGYYVPASQDHIDIQFLPQSGRLHLGLPALRPSLGGDLRQRASRRNRCARAWNATWTSAASPARTRRSTATCCRRSTRRPGRRIAWRATVGWRWATPPAWSIPSPAKALYYAMRSGDLAARVVLDERSAWRKKPPPTAPCCARDFAADLEFGARSRQTRLPGAASCSIPCPPGWCSSSGAARASAPHAGPVRRHAAVSGIEEPPAAQSERHADESLMNFFLERVIPERSSASSLHHDESIPIRSLVCARAESDSRRRQFAGARLSRRRRHSAASSRAAKARTSSTSMATTISIMSAPGDRCCWAIVREFVIDALREVLDMRHQLRRAHRARNRTGRADLRNACPPWRWCGWSTPAPKPP